MMSNLKITFEDQEDSSVLSSSCFTGLKLRILHGSLFPIICITSYHPSIAVTMQLQHPWPSWLSITGSIPNTLWTLFWNIPRKNLCLYKRSRNISNSGCKVRGFIDNWINTDVNSSFTSRLIWLGMAHSAFLVRQLEVSAPWLSISLVLSK